MRGLSYNTDENGDLRIERSRQLHQYQKAGYTVVFVDESHRSVGNVRKRTWGEKGKTLPNSTPHTFFLELCLCDKWRGRESCRLFQPDFYGEIFEACITELVNFSQLKTQASALTWTTLQSTKRSSYVLEMRTTTQSSSTRRTRPNAIQSKWCFDSGRPWWEKLVNVDIAVMITNISRCFDDITRAEIKRAVKRFLFDVTYKIYNREDI